MERSADDERLAASSKVKAKHQGSGGRRYPCQNCGIQSVGCKSCSGCQKAHYCGKDCQKAHWKSSHKRQCQNAKADPTTKTTKAPKPSTTVPTGNMVSIPGDEEKCPECHSNSIQEGCPLMCFACGDFAVCGSCAATPKYGGNNARPTKIVYLCDSCDCEGGDDQTPKAGVLLTRLLDQKPTGAHVQYARLMVAQIKLQRDPVSAVMGLEQDIKTAKQEFLWLANNLDYAPAQLALATFMDPSSHPSGDAWDGPLPLQLIEGCQGHASSPFPGNEHLSKNYYNRSAQQEWPLALTMLGTMYKKGVLYPQNYSRAVKYLTMAADMGDSLAANNLSQLYLNGAGCVRKDTIQGLAFLHQAAANGLFHAMFVFGQLGMSNAAIREDGKTYMMKLVEAKWDPSGAHPLMPTIYAQLRQFYGV